MLELAGKLAFAGLALGLAAAAVSGTVAWWAGRWGLARGIALAAAAAATVYGATLLVVSRSSRERVIPAGAELAMCDLDCDLFFSVAGARHAPAPAGTPAGSTLWRVSVRARSDARRVNMDPRGCRVELVDASGRVWPPRAAGRGEPAALFERTLAPGESAVGTCDFLLRAEARAPRLHFGPGPWFTRFVLADENSFLHRRTLLALEPAGAAAAAGDRERVARR